MKNKCGIVKPRCWVLRNGINYYASKKANVNVKATRKKGFASTCDPSDAMEFATLAEANKAQNNAYWYGAWDVYKRGKRTFSTKLLAKRIAVLKDVKKLLSEGVIIPRTGWGYVCTANYKTLLTCEELKSDLPLVVILKQHKNCAVCARGALFVGQASRSKITVSSFTQEARVDTSTSCSQFTDDHINTKLFELFTKSELSAIENCFESEGWGPSFRSTSAKSDIASATKKLTLIVDHMLANGSKFSTARFKDTKRTGKLSKAR